MLEAIQFVKGAVASKDLAPVLVHFRISNRTIRGYNGMMGLCCPIDLDLEVTPKAVEFFRAVQACKEAVQMHVTPSKRLAIKSGKFKAFIDCIEEEYPEVVPEGQYVQLNGNLLDVLRILNPFIAEDASRPWARGILFRGQSAFATNNVTLLEYWLGYNFPGIINIPKKAVSELLRIGEEPVSMQVAENSVTFHYSENRWLRTQTYPTEWPDLGRILNMPSKAVPPPDNLWESIADLVPFVDDLGRIFLTKGGISTAEAEGVGAAVDIPGLPDTGCFNHKQLTLIGEVATHIDFTGYPGPCHFFGKNIRGATVGMRYSPPTA